MASASQSGPSEDTRPAPGRAWLVPAALLVAWALVAWRSRPPAPLGPDAPPGRFSAARAVATHARVFSGVPHPSGSPAHAAVRAALAAELEALGLEVEPHETLVRDGNRIAVVRNVLARLPGREPGAGVLLVAHSDSVWAGSGASDDGAGVVTLLETARALTAGEPLRRDVLWLFSDGEEDGLFGARAFCAGHPWLERAGVVLNFEARGTGGPSMLFQTSGPNRWLLEAAAGALDRPWTSSVADLVYNSMPNDTDLSAFIAVGVPGINFAFIDGLARYHTPRDDLAHLDRGSLQQHGDSALALTRAFAARDLDRTLGQVPDGEPPGSAVFFDLLGFGIALWPSGWSPPLALVAAALGAAALVRARARRRGESTPLRLGRALGRVLGVLALGVLLGSAGPWLVGRLSGLPYPGLAHPWTLELATWGGVLVALTLFAPRMPDRARADAAFFALWLVQALAALVAAWLQPAVCYLFLVPAAVAGAGALLAPRHLPAIEALAALLTGTLWLPIVFGLRLGFDFALPPLVAAPVALVSLWVAPWVLRGSRRNALALRRCALAALLLGTLAGRLLPGATEESPGWLSLRFACSAGASGSIETDPEGVELPEAMRAALATVAPTMLMNFFPEDCREVAVTPRWDAPPPAVETLEQAAGSPTAAHRRRLRLTSSRGASRLFVRLPDGVRLLWASRPSGGAAGSVDGGPESYWIFSGLGPEGLELELGDWPRKAADGGPVSLMVGDESAELPSFMDALRAARPATLVPRGRGDTSIVWTQVEF